MSGFLNRFTRWLGIALFFSSVGMNGMAQTRPEVARGLQWLAGQVQNDGSLQNEAQSVASPLQNRSETEQTLRALADLPATLPQAIAQDTDGNTEYLARQLISLVSAAQPTDAKLAQLLVHQNEDGGLGAYAEFSSNALDTAWFVLATSDLPGGNVSSARVAALNYLLTNQNVNGGYSMPGNSSQIHITAMVANAIASMPSTAASQNALTKLSAWLVAQQQSDGSFGTVDETALALLSLLGTGSDTGLQSAVSLFLLAQQSSDGSWNGDAYQTALALRALVARARPLPTTGNVLVHVQDGVLGQAIKGATAMILTAQNLPAVSDASGKITYTDLPAGSGRMAISAPGYAGVEIGFNLVAGSTLDLGVVRLNVQATKGIIRGQVKDAVTGRGLADATITVSGAANASVQTASDGSYNLPDLTPGNVVVAASKNGYNTVQGSGSVVAGGILAFSPTLSLTSSGQPPTTGAITGQVLDRVTRAPLAGVTIRVEGSDRTGTSDASGRFTVSGIAGGTWPVSFSLAGYVAQSWAAVLIAEGSVADFQVVELAKAQSTVSVQGRVTDIHTGRPIAGASVSVLGGNVAPASTDANGVYRIEGLTSGDLTLRFGASGYASETVNVTFPQVGEYALNKTLNLDNGGNPVFAQLQTDQASYPAHTPVTIQMAIENRASVAIDNAVMDITIFDPSGSVIQTQEAIRLDSDGVAQNQFTFLPGTTTPVDVKWTTQAYAPGNYQVKARIFTEDVERGARTVLAERTISLVIAPSQHVMRLSVTPLPGFTTFEATETLRFKVEATHQSNLPVSVPFSTRFTTPAGVVLHEASGEIVLQPNDVSGQVVVGPFNYRFPASGVYPVRLSSNGAVLPDVIADGEVQVAPGIRVEVQQSVTPRTVTPDGDKRIQIQLQLKGVEQK